MLKEVIISPLKKNVKKVLISNYGTVLTELFSKPLTSSSFSKPFPSYPQPPQLQTLLSILHSYLVGNISIDIGNDAYR